MGTKRGDCEQRTDEYEGWVIHGPAVCAGTNCPFHNPSDHVMKAWPKVIRASTLVERTCPHGCGHPDPDSVDHFTRQGVSHMDVHGCDGCCNLKPWRHPPEVDRVLVVAVTGGPCAGKSTVMATLRDALKLDGYGVAVAPEAATLLLHGGLALRGATRENFTALQAEIGAVQVAVEYALTLSLSQGDRQGILLCDRGLVDNKAYMDSRQWQQVQASLGMSEREMLGRYDVVLHLVSAAKGAREHYKNTPERVETALEAAALEERTRAAWGKHRRRAVVDNRTDFDGKVLRAVRAVKKLLAEVP